MDSPIWGMMMSVGMISFHAAHGSDRGPDANEYYIVCRSRNGKLNVDPSPSFEKLKGVRF